MACKDKEGFASFQISRLIDSDFGRKPQKFDTFTPTSPTGPPPAATSPALAPFTSPSPTPAPSAPVPFASSSSHQAREPHLQFILSHQARDPHLQFKPLHLQSILQRQ